MYMTTQHLNGRGGGGGGGGGDGGGRCVYFGFL